MTIKIAIRKWSEFETPPNATSRCISRPLQARNRPRTKVTQPTSGLSGGLGVGREGKRVGREDKEKQEGHQVAGKHKPPPPTIPPHPPSPLSILAQEGGL